MWVPLSAADEFGAFLYLLPCTPVTALLTRLRPPPTLSLASTPTAWLVPAAHVDLSPSVPPLFAPGTQPTSIPVELCASPGSVGRQLRPAPGHKLLFLLAGQSNMAGRGAPPFPLPQPYRPHPRLLRLAADRRWVAASPPLHANIDTHKTCGLGPAMPFAHRVLLSSSADSAPSSVVEPSSGGGGGEPGPVVLGLVPCAVGGTRIWMWVRGQPLYEAAIARTRAAVADSGGALGAVLWFQGESDTIEVDDARAYGGKMERLVADLRADLGLPSLLVIQDGNGELAHAMGVELDPRLYDRQG